MEGGRAAFFQIRRGRTVAGRAIHQRNARILQRMEDPRKSDSLNFTSFTPASVNATWSQLIRHGLVAEKFGGRAIL